MPIDYTVTTIQEIRDLIAHHGDLGTPLDELPEGLYHTTATLIVRVDTYEGLIDFHAGECTDQRVCLKNGRF